MCRDFRDKIPDGINPLRNSEPLIYVPSANGPDPLTKLTLEYSCTALGTTPDDDTEDTENVEHLAYQQHFREVELSGEQAWNDSCEMASKPWPCETRSFATTTVLIVR